MAAMASYVPQQQLKSPSQQRYPDRIRTDIGAVSFPVFALPKMSLKRDISAQAWWSRKAATSQAIPSQDEVASSSSKTKNGAPPEQEEEVEITWVQEKTEELVRLTNDAVKLVPGPRVGTTTMPWLLAVPVAYLGITFVIAVYRTIQKYRSPRMVKKRMIGKNAYLLKSLDQFLPAGRSELNYETLQQLEKKCGFDSKEVLRKYIRYAMNERTFNPDAVADLIHLRKVTRLDDEDVAAILNDISERIVKEKGPVMMNLQGLTLKGVKRKAAVQALFSKLLYLSELDEFCSTAKDSLKVKEIFGVTDEDANSIKIETLSELTDVESLEKMVDVEDDDEKNA